MYMPPVDAAADMASVLLEAVEAAEGEAPGPAADAVPVCVDACAEVLPAEAFVVDEGHFWIWVDFCRLGCGFGGLVERVSASRSGSQRCLVGVVKYSRRCCLDMYLFVFLCSGVLGCCSDKSISGLRQEIAEE